MRFLARYSVFTGLLLFFSCSAALAADNIDLPDFGASSAAGISPMEEKRMGESFMRSVRQMLPLVEDPLITDYIRHLGTKLANYSDNKRYDFNFFVVDDPNINAFAGPAGNIGVHSGLIMSAASESELASVMSHEIAHITQYHIHRSIQKARSMGLPTAAAIIAGILLSATDPSAAEALITVGIVGTAQAQLNYSRQHELEADRIGIKLMAEAGYNPRAMPAFFETLYKQTRVVSSDVPEFLSTHPVTENRIADTRNRAEQYPFKQFTNSVEFYLTRVRIKHLKEKDYPQLVKHYLHELKQGNYANELASRYGLILAYIETKEFESAKKEITQLIKSDYERIPYLLAWAELESNSGNLKQAQLILENAMALYPDNQSIGVRYAEILLSTNQTSQARRIARQFVHAGHTTPMVLNLLSNIEKQAGNMGLAMEYLAESHFIHGRISRAIEILQQALRQKDLSNQDRDRINAKLSSYKQEFTQQKQSAKK